MDWQGNYKTHTHKENTAERQEETRTNTVQQDRNRHFTISCKIVAHFDFYSSNTSQKKLEQSDVYHCVASSLLLTTVWKLNKGTGCWSFRRGMSSRMLSHSCLIVTSSGISLSDFSFYGEPNVFSWWKVWTAGRPVHQGLTSLLMTNSCESDVPKQRNI